MQELGWSSAGDDLCFWRDFTDGRCHDTGGHFGVQPAVVMAFVEKVLAFTETQGSKIGHVTGHTGCSKKTDALRVPTQ